MRMIATTLCCVSMLLASPLSAQRLWEHIARSATAELSLDTASIGSAGNGHMLGWGRMVEGDKTTMGLYHFDCAQQRARLERTVSFSPDGQFLGRDGAGSWVEIPPGSAMDGLFRRICSRRDRPGLLRYNLSDFGLDAEADAEGWVKFGGSATAEGFVNLRSVGTAGEAGRMAAWVKTVNRNGDYAEGLYEFACAQREMRVVRATNFRANGSVVGSSQDPSPWTEARGGNRILTDIVCPRSSRTGLVRYPRTEDRRAVRIQPRSVPNANPDLIATAAGHIQWAIGNTGPCTRALVCAQWSRVLVLGDIPVFVTRLDRSAREMIILAKVAQNAGFNDVAFDLVQSTQVHNQGVSLWMASNKAAVLAALASITVPDLGSSADIKTLVRNWFHVPIY